MTQRVPAIISDIRKITPTIIEVELARKNGGNFPPFFPGQYMTIAFPAHTRIKGERPFSIASSPAKTTSLIFGIRMLGRYTRGMQALKKGDSAYVNGPFGEFTLDPVRDHHAILIAGGIGVTPFLSMLQAATDLNMPNDIRLLYSVRSREEAAYMDVLDSLQQRNPNVRVLYVISDEQSHAQMKNIVSGRITRDTIAGACDNVIFDRTFFVCGPPAFMKAMTHNLRSLGVPANMIFSEKFGVASSAFYELRSPFPKLVVAGWALAVLAIGGVLVHKEQEKRTQINAALSAIEQNSNATLPLNSQPTATNTTPTTLPTNINSKPSNANTSVKTSTPTNTPTPAPAPTIVTPTPAPQQTAPVQPRTRMS